MSETSFNKRVFGLVYTRLDPNFPFGQTSDTSQPLSKFGKRRMSSLNPTTLIGIPAPELEN